MPDRTTVVLPSPLKQRAVARAREQGISFGEFVRRAVESMLTAPPRGTARKKTADPFWDNLKVFERGPADLAARHDSYLYGGKPRSSLIRVPSWLSTTSGTSIMDRPARIFPSVPRPFSTSNLVVDELATLLGRTAGYRYAADRVDDLYTSESVDVLPSTRNDEVEAIRWMRKYADKEISFTDCVFFAMMRRLRIRTIFTLDRHFRDAGFQILSTPLAT